MALGRWRFVVRGMQVAILAMLAFGAATWNVSVLVNSAFAFGVTLLPWLLARDYDVDVRPSHAVVVTAAVFLHAVGMVGPYHTVWWWDHLTHVLSAALVAAVAYTATATVDRLVEELYLPPSFMFAFILLVTLATGVLWEVVEFVMRAVAHRTGNDPVLVQYGLEDTMLDLAFDAAGGALVAAGGSRILAPDVRALTHRIRGPGPKR